MANVAMSDRTLDVVAALDMMIDMLDGPGTRDRLIHFELAFCNSQQLVRGKPASSRAFPCWLAHPRRHPLPALATSQPIYQPQEAEEIRNLFRRLDALTTLQSKYASAHRYML